jgi:ribosomal protein S18 acetylase RimI-like enzyme
MQVIIIEPGTKDQFRDYYDLRWRVLRQPHGQPRGSEKDDLEEMSIHLMAYYGQKMPAAAGRAHFNSRDEAQIRFMAVDPCCRNSGIGSSLLSGLEKRAKIRGARYIILNSRESAIGFYEKNGYIKVGEAGSLFGNISHVRMKKDLAE